ncbi:MAG: hypothetical protein IT270_14155 [Saprospiraceae bacterium]|nr:hypothetical protein [Saprospiraceae bacterium]
MRFFAFVLLVFVSATLYAQPKQNAPYSRYGLGNPINQYFSNQAGWGGMTAAFHDPHHLNIGNPASFAFLRTTVLDNGLYGKYSSYQSEQEKLETWSGNLAYLALGFTLRSPINEVMDKAKSPWKYGMGFSLTPYTVVGYNVITRENISEPAVDSVSSNYTGSGGTYRFTWSNAMRYKNTAAGINLGWQFGETVYENTNVFSDSFPTFINTYRDQISVTGFVWKLGVQHDWALKYAENDKDVALKFITFGLSGEGKHKMRTTSDVLRVRSRGVQSNGQFNDPDTLLVADNVRRDLTIPASFSLGAMYTDLGKLRVGAEYTFTGGKAYSNEIRPETQRNASSVSAGVEFIPDILSYNNYFRRIRYRFGAYYRQDTRLVNGDGIDDTGLSVGFGFPLVLPRQQTSYINSSLEFGKVGAGTPIEETYFRITLGFTMNDNSWFFKRRFE